MWVAVANALPAARERADWVTRADHGAGVMELIDAILADDLANLEPRLGRHDLLLGTEPHGVEMTIPSYGVSVLVAGPSGSGKSTVATSLLERLNEKHYQFCVLDPEGDYDELPGALHFGNSQQAPVPARSRTAARGAL